MKKYLFALLVAILATTSVNAQQISVVSASGSTTLYNSLPEAIKGASANSVLYLPGGGFNIADSVIITKKLTSQLEEMQKQANQAAPAAKK